MNHTTDELSNRLEAWADNTNNADRYRIVYSRFSREYVVFDWHLRTVGRYLLLEDAHEEACLQARTDVWVAAWAEDAA